MRRSLLAPLVAVLAVCVIAPATAEATAYRGKLEVIHSDDFAHGRGQTTWTLRTPKGKRIPVLPTRPTDLRSGTKVTVRGKKKGRFVAGAIHRRGSAPLHAASALGEHNVAVILIKFAGDTEPWTPGYVKGRIFDDPDSTAAFYNEESLGDITVTGDVFGWYTIAGPNTSCDYSTWANQANSAAQADGKNLSGYDHVMYVLPDQSACGWAGLGELPGSRTWLNGDISVRVAAHELGHNMGLHHASSYYCTSGGAPVTLSSTCSSSEYGDPYDVMGMDAGSSNAWHLDKLGVVRSGEVQTVSASGTYTLRAADTHAAGKALLRVPAGNGSGRWYDLSIRKPGMLYDNFTASDPAATGVEVHYDPSLTTTTQSLLLDAKPGIGGFTDSTLAQGSTFTSGGVSITASSVGPGTATVDVVMSATADTTPPSAPAGLAAHAGAPGTIDLAWGASSDDVGVSGYRVYRDDVLVANTPSTAWSDQFLAPGATHKYRVAAFDAAGNSALSAPVYVTVASPPDPGAGDGGSGAGDSGDKTAPVVRVTSPTKSAKLRRRRAATIVAKATDNVGVVRLELSIDGQAVAVTDRGQLKRKWSLKRVRPGRHLIMVRAYDAQGNFGRRIVRVRVLKK